MGTYENFARVYDELMDNVPYREWGNFILARLKEEGIEAVMKIEDELKNEPICLVRLFKVLIAFIQYGIPPLYYSYSR